MNKALHNPLLDAALGYAAYGIAVLPIASRNKSPLTTHGVKDATTCVKQIANWWAEHPTANLGLATGNVSGFWVLDVDGDDGEITLASLEHQHGALPPTVEAITGSGRHIYFRMPDRRTVANSVKKIGLGLDVRGDGGYVVAPPSVHQSGRRYSWSVDCGDFILPAPEWLSCLVQSPTGNRTFTSPIEWKTLLNGVSEGQRNSSLARLAGKLLYSRVDPYIALDICLVWNEARCKPPLSTSEVKRTVDSIAARELLRRGRKT